MHSKRLPDSKLDVVFKMLFARPDANDLLIALLNDVLEPEVPIASVTLLNPDLAKDSLSDRGTVLDPHVRLADGRVVDVEMQMRRDEILKRAVYGLARLQRPQLDVGDDYRKLKPCIGIVFPGYRRAPSECCHSKFRFRDVRTGEELCDDLELHFVELPKLPAAHTEEYRRGGGLARWASFLINDAEELMRELETSDERTAKERALLRELALDPEAQRIIREREESQMLYEMELESWEARGKAKGKAEAVLAMLDARGLPLSEVQRSTIRDCGEMAELDRWVRRVLSVGSFDESLRRQPARRV